jgi:osmoprotectant transport system ATP-binding protein
VVIELLDVSKRYGDRVAVAHLSLTIPRGSLAVLIGPSGCGKTTALKMINRLVAPDSGEVRIDGRPVTDADPVALRRAIGWVIQDVGLFPHMSVAENIAVVPGLLKWAPGRIASRVAEVLDLVTLDAGFAPRYPHELSGGERQRVGLARALAADPQVLLMDEPFASVDPANRARLQDMLLDVQERIRKTIVFVTHDINEAVKLGDSIAVLRSGALVQQDTAARLLARPADALVGQLLGRDRSLKALALERARDFATGDGFLVAAAVAGDAEIVADLDRAEAGCALLIDARGRLRCRAVSDGKGGLARDWSPATVDRNANLSEVLSAMLACGEETLPVVDGRGHPAGMISLPVVFARLLGRGGMPGGGPDGAGAGAPAGYRGG